MFNVKPVRKPLIRALAGVLTISALAVGGLPAHAAAVQEAGEVRGALPLLQTAVAESPGHAEAQFRLAECELAVSNPPAGAERFARARDLDALPFRADSALNERARAVARRFASRGVVWLDAADALVRTAPEGVPGGESFYEHVHLNFEGNYRLARLFAEQIDPHGGAPLGNFPQAFTHVGLINAALTIARLRGEGPVPTEADRRHRDGVGRRGAHPRTSAISTTRPSAMASWAATPIAVAINPSGRPTPAGRPDRTATRKSRCSRYDDPWWNPS